MIRYTHEATISGHVPKECSTDDDCDGECIDGFCVDEIGEHILVNEDKLTEQYVSYDPAGNRVRNSEGQVISAEPTIEIESDFTDDITEGDTVELEPLSEGMRSYSYDVKSIEPVYSNTSRVVKTRVVLKL